VRLLFHQPDEFGIDQELRIDPRPHDNQLHAAFAELLPFGAGRRDLNRAVLAVEREVGLQAVIPVLDEAEDFDSEGGGRDL
jgi:hypothetical protein